MVDPYETGHFKAVVLNLKFPYIMKDSKQCAQRVMYMHTHYSYTGCCYYISEICVQIFQ
jgi:hypothetical protein